MLAHGFAFDSVQMPLKCFDGTFRSFEVNVVPEAAKRGMAVIGMKSLGGGGQAVQAGIVDPEESGSGGRSPRAEGARTSS